MKILGGLSKGQVLQRLGHRGANVQITGKSLQDGPVTATIFSGTKALSHWKKREVGRVLKSKFEVELKDIPPGGPYRLELRSGGAKVQVQEFYVGDVWVLAGQSNMQGCGSLAEAAKPHPQVRAFSMRREWGKAVEPICFLAESPDPIHNGGKQSPTKETRVLKKNSNKGVGPGIPFGVEMWRRSGVPQGLICTAHGGTSMAQWSPQRILEGQTSLYGSLLNSVAATGQPVAGVLWYQGESDANLQAASCYTERMKELVQALRKDIKKPSLPWMIVQIARVFREETPETERHWNKIQEQQRLLPCKIKNLAVVAAIDLPMEDNIHISGKGHGRLGIRLAREADRLVYGNRKELPSPRLQSIALSKGSHISDASGLFVDLGFDGVVGNLHSRGEPEGFSLVGPDGEDLRLIYRTSLHGNRVRLHLRSTVEEAKVVYGRGTISVCNITDSRDQALLVFGPQRLAKPRAILPFITQWNVTDPFESPVPLNRLSVPEMKKMSSEIRVYGENEFRLEGFINERPRWTGRNGLGCFEASMVLPEAMRLEVLMGYDGPFRVWFNRKSFFTDMQGSNPCFADQSSKAIALSAGKHSIQVAMDLNHGSAWGFFLRFVRKDIAPALIESGHYAKPVYGV